MMNEQNSPECVKYYEKCIEINNRSYLTYNGLGNFYLKQINLIKQKIVTPKLLKLIQKDLQKFIKIVLILREKQNKNSECKR